MYGSCGNRSVHKIVVIGSPLLCKCQRSFARHSITQWPQHTTVSLLVVSIPAIINSYLSHSLRCQIAIELSFHIMVVPRPFWLVIPSFEARCLSPIASAMLHISCFPSLIVQKTSAVSSLYVFLVASFPRRLPDNLTPRCLMLFTRSRLCAPISRRFAVWLHHRLNNLFF